jgi:cytochrome b
MTNRISSTIAVWDLPVRICHWSFAFILPAMWWTAENGEMGWHMRLGLILLGLLVFRILWGFFGSSTARFASFLRGPGKVLAYLSGRTKWPATALGHNPAGGWSAAALILAMLVQVTMGLFAGDPYDGATGPLNEVVGVLTADMLTDWHHTFFYAVLALVCLHLLAVAFYSLVKKDRLIPAMVTGKRTMPEAVAGMIAASAWRVVVCTGVAIAVMWWVWSGGPGL